MPKDADVTAAIGKFVGNACKKRVVLRAKLAQQCKTLFGTQDVDGSEDEIEGQPLALPLSA